MNDTAAYDSIVKAVPKQAFAMIMASDKTYSGNIYGNKIIYSESQCEAGIKLLHTIGALEPDQETMLTAFVYQSMFKDRLKEIKKDRFWIIGRISIVLILFLAALWRIAQSA